MTSTSGPLSGLHVIDVSTFVAGPSCTMTLAQLGADVVRVDALQGGPDLGRHPLAPDGSSLYWTALNRGKRVVRLDLRSDEGREELAELVTLPGNGHGIVVSNVVGRSWVDYEHLSRRRPDLVMVQIEGRPDGSPAVDYTVNCETGLPGITGRPDRHEPVNSVLPSWDLLAGMHAALAIVAACRRRDETGAGALIRISLTDVAAATLAHLGLVADAVVNRTDREPDGNYLYGTYGHDFTLADGRRVMVTALTSRHWTELVRVCSAQNWVERLEAEEGVSLVDEGTRYEYRTGVTRALAPWFRRHTLPAAAAALDAAGVPWGEYRTVREMASEADGLIARSAIFRTAEEGYPVPGSVARSSAWESPPLDPPRPVAADEVLTHWRTPAPAGERRR